MKYDYYYIPNVVLEKDIREINQTIRKASVAALPSVVTWIKQDRLIEVQVRQDECLVRPD